MIKIILVQRDYTDIAPTMIGMTGFAIQGRRAAVFAVKPRFFVEISSDELMTVEAQLFLGCITQAYVAVGTLRLVLCMARYELSRHEEFLDLDCHRLVATKGGQKQDQDKQGSHQ
jgi:hypothetical protein